MSVTITSFVLYGWLKTDSGIAYEARLGAGYNYIFVVAASTVVWLIITFVTPAEKLETLKRFYQKVKPNSAWSIVGHVVDYKDLGKKFTTCVGLTILVYSDLLLIGKMMLG